MFSVGCPSTSQPITITITITINISISIAITIIDPPAVYALSSPLPARGVAGAH